MPETPPEPVFDTTQQQLGAVYARALLGATERAGTTDTVLEELEVLVTDVLVKVPNLEGTLTSPRVPLEAKEAIMERAFQGRLSAELLTFLRVVARRGRFECLRAITRAVRALHNELRGRVRVHVRSAAAMDDAARELVTGQLQATLGREIDLQLDVDPDLIGGLVVRVGDTVYDGSIANRLSRLRNDLFVNATEKIRGEVDRFAATD